MSLKNSIQNAINVHIEEIGLSATLSIIEKFIERFPDRLNKIKVAIDSKYASEQINEVHSLRTAFAIIGDLHTARYLEKIEIDLKKHNLSSITVEQLTYLYKSSEETVLSLKEIMNVLRGES